MICDTAWKALTPTPKLWPRKWSDERPQRHTRVETAAAILYHILKYSPIHDKILVQEEIQVFWNVTQCQLVNSDRQNRALYYLHIQAQAIRGTSSP